MASNYIMEATKEEVFNACIAFLSSKINDIKSSIESVKESSKNDTKSSMGDKYETSREMLQQEINRLEKQLADANQQLFTLKNITIHKKSDKIIPGSFVSTTMGDFFIAVAIGELNIHNSKVFVISPVSPLGKNLQGKQMNNTFVMNNKEIKILSIH
jgi:transcription elongation GreA/GreB family factor